MRLYPSDEEAVRVQIGRDGVISSEDGNGRRADTAVHRSAAAITRSGRWPGVRRRRVSHPLPSGWREARKTRTTGPAGAKTGRR